MQTTMRMIRDKDSFFVYLILILFSYNMEHSKLFGSCFQFFNHHKERIVDDNDQDAQFYARADNLVTWLNLVEKRLGGLSQKLSASVEKERLNTDLSGDSAATQSSYRPSELKVQTSWLKIDDNFLLV